MSCPFWSPFSTLPLDLRAEVGLRDDPTTVVAIKIRATMGVCAGTQASQVSKFPLPSSPQRKFPGARKTAGVCFPGTLASPLLWLSLFSFSHLESLGMPRNRLLVTSRSGRQTNVGARGLGWALFLPEDTAACLGQGQSSVRDRLPGGSREG